MSMPKVLPMSLPAALPNPLPIRASRGEVEDRCLLAAVLDSMAEGPGRGVDRLILKAN